MDSLDRVSRSRNPERRPEGVDRPLPIVDPETDKRLHWMIGRQSVESILTNNQHIARRVVGDILHCAEQARPVVAFAAGRNNA